MCVIVFIPSIEDSSIEKRREYLKIAQETAKTNKKKPLSFLWSEGG